MNYLTIKEIKDIYGYNRYQLINLRKNGKVRFLENPLRYAEIDIKRANKEDFIYETIMKTRKLKVDIGDELREYQIKFGKEFRKVLFGMMKGKFYMSLNEYSKYGPFNSYDNRSLYILAQGEASRYLTSWNKQKENFEKWKIGKSKKKVNDRKLYLMREFQKIKIKRKNFLYFIGDDDKINCRLKIQDGYLYLPSMNGKRRKKIFVGGYWGEGKQTVTVVGNVITVTFYVKKKKKKYKGVTGVDINANNLSVSCIDKNGCLRKRKTFKLGNIVNLRNKKVEIMKLLLEIKRWSGGYGNFVLEDLNLSGTHKNRKLSNIIYGQIRQNSFILGDVKFVNPAFTSFIGLTKYSNLGMSIKHFGGSKDESAAYVIARRGLGFKEKLPKFSYEIKMNNWSSWSYLKKNFGEQGTRKLFGL